MYIVPSASGTASLAPLTTPLRKTLSNVEVRRLSSLHSLNLDKDAPCSTCQGRKSFKIRTPVGIGECACSCQEQRMLGYLLLAAGIGDTFQRYSWLHTTGISAEVKEQVMEYMFDLDSYIASGIGLMLWSPRNGTGKSMLAYLVMKQAISQGYRCYYTTFAELIDYHTDGWTSPEQRLWFTRHIQNADVLGIDDLGKENPNRANVVNELLDKVIRARAAHSRPTVFTSNLRPDVDPATVGTDFSRYQAGLLSLLTERTLTIEVTAPDFRPQRNQQMLQDVKDGIRHPVVIC